MTADVADDDVDDRERPLDGPLVDVTQNSRSYCLLNDNCHLPKPPKPEARARAKTSDAEHGPCWRSAS